MTPSSVDVVVAGAGPAGLATAIGARQHGLQVAVVDPRRRPIDRACGEGIMPRGWSSLEALGVNVPANERFPFQGVRYVSGDTVAEGLFSQGCGFGIRRTILHEAMAGRAESLGVAIRWGVRGLMARPDGLETDSGFIPAPFVVVADGRASRIRERCGLTGRPAPLKRIGLRRHFLMEPWSDHVEVHWAEGCEAYVTPVGPSLVGIAILTGARTRDRFDTLLNRFPALKKRLQGASAASAVLGAGPFSGHARRVARDRVALVGDASLCLDPLTGEGLSLAFRQASSLAEALKEGDLQRYVAAHGRIVRGPRRITRLVLLLTRSPRLRRLALQALAADGRLFTRFLDKMNQGLSPQPGDLLRLLATGIRGGG